MPVIECTILARECTISVRECTSSTIPVRECTNSTIPVRECHGTCRVTRVCGVYVGACGGVLVGRGLGKPREVGRGEGGGNQHGLARYAKINFP
jgi:hypothetical protein